MSSPKNKPIVINTIKVRLKLADPALAEEGYQDVLKSLEKNPTPSLDGMRNMHRLLRTRNPSIDKVKAEQLIYDRFMRKLDESGFINRLYNAYGGQMKRSTRVMEYWSVDMRNSSSHYSSAPLLQHS